MTLHKILRTENQQLFLGVFWIRIDGTAKKFKNLINQVNYMYNVVEKCIFTCILFTIFTGSQLRLYFTAYNSYGYLHSTLYLQSPPPPFMPLLSVTKRTKWPSHTMSDQSVVEIFLTRCKSFGVCLATVTRRTQIAWVRAGKTPGKSANKHFTLHSVLIRFSPKQNFPKRVYYVTKTNYTTFTMIYTYKTEQQCSSAVIMAVDYIIHSAESNVILQYVYSL